MKILRLAPALVLLALAPFGCRSLLHRRPEPPCTPPVLIPSTPPVIVPAPANGPPLAIPSARPDTPNR